MSNLRDELARAIRGGRKADKKQPYEGLPSVLMADRILASGVIAEVWDEGFDAGERDVFNHESDGWSEHSPCITNPYPSQASDEETQ